VLVLCANAVDTDAAIRADAPNAFKVAYRIVPPCIASL
jgi:hypothetical protein